MESPVEPSECHFSEFYSKDDYDGGCDREERRIKIVQDAVTNILHDFTTDLSPFVLFSDVAEAKGLASKMNIDKTPSKMDGCSEKGLSR